MKNFNFYFDFSEKILTKKSEGGVQKIKNLSIFFPKMSFVLTLYYTETLTKQ